MGNTIFSISQSVSSIPFCVGSVVMVQLFSVPFGGLPGNTILWVMQFHFSAATSCRMGLFSHVLLTHSRAFFCKVVSFLIPPAPIRFPPSFRNARQHEEQTHQQRGGGRRGGGGGRGRERTSGRDHRSGLVCPGYGKDRSVTVFSDRAVEIFVSSGCHFANEWKPASAAAVCGLNFRHYVSRYIDRYSTTSSALV